MEQTNGIRGDAGAEWLISNRYAAKILDSYLLQSEQAFKSRIQAANLVLTGKLLNSFRRMAVAEGDGYV